MLELLQFANQIRSLAENPPGWVSGVLGTIAVMGLLWTSRKTILRKRPLSAEAQRIIRYVQSCVGSATNLKKGANGYPTAQIDGVLRVYRSEACRPWLRGDWPNWRVEVGGYDYTSFLTRREVAAIVREVRQAHEETRQQRLREDRARARSKIGL